MTKQKVRDEGRENKYFHQMLNMADDDLDPYQYRLLGHYKRVCGESEDGACWESTRTTAKNCKMSVGKVTSTRRELQALGYVQIKEAEADETLTITLRDLMEANVARYIKRSSSEQVVHPVNAHVQEVNNHVHGMNESVHQVKQRRTIEEEHTEEEHTEEKKQQLPAALETPKSTPINVDEPLPEPPRVYTVFVENMRQQITPVIADKLKDAVKEFGEQWVEDAIVESVTHNAKTWAYAERILDRWGKEGRDTKSVHSKSYNLQSAEVPHDGKKYISGPYADFIEH